RVLFRSNLPTVRHGVAVACQPVPPVDPLFAGIPAPFEAGCYHSWAAAPSTLPPELRVTAYSAEGVIMAVRHVRYPACGVQFHPESVLTPCGERLIQDRKSTRL